MKRRHDSNWLVIFALSRCALLLAVQAKTLQNTSLNLADDFPKPPAGKECPGTVVVGIASARLLRGCTLVKGNLEIAIREECQSIVRELEESLEDIEVIDGYLRVLRSHPLSSLGFLKNLKEIRGNELGFNHYSLLVVDNLNLRELWNWDDRGPIKIGSNNGDPKILVHYNPKLCPEVCVLLNDLMNF